MPPGVPEVNSKTSGLKSQLCQCALRETTAHRSRTWEPTNHRRDPAWIAGSGLWPSPAPGSAVVGTYKQHMEDLCQALCLSNKSNKQIKRQAWKAKSKLEILWVAIRVTEEKDTVSVKEEKQCISALDQGMRGDLSHEVMVELSVMCWESSSRGHLHYKWSLFLSRRCLPNA